MRRVLRSLLVVAAGIPSAALRADETRRISSAPNGVAGNAYSFDASISADGNVIVFSSSASDLVAGDTNRATDVFTFDRSTGIVERVSVATDGAQGNDTSGYGRISSDGRFVAFSSNSTNLDVDPNGGIGDVFVRDRVLGTTTLVSRDLNGKGADNHSYVGGISADGQRVVFDSYASNLVANDVNGTGDVFLFDSASGTISLVSALPDGTQGDDLSFDSHLSSDGNVVAFQSYASNFPDPPPFLAKNAYVKDLTTGALENLEDGVDNAVTWLAGISRDGSFVAFASWFPFVADDTNGLFDIYLRDRVAGTTERVSVATAGRELDRESVYAGISDDARFVVFTTASDNVVDNDGDEVDDVYVRDRLHDVTTRVSVGSRDEDSAADSFLYNTVPISADGAYIVFQSWATEFDANDGNNALDVFLRERSLLTAGSTNYGAGFPGRGGAIPTMTTDHVPFRGSAVRVFASCSSQLYTTAFVFIGLTRDSIATSLGGTLLLDPLVSFPLALTPYGGSFAADVPDDWWADGLVVDLQTLELDPWAAKGVSFTDGLELTLGDG